jgi:hypothetical protein
MEGNRRPSAVSAPFTAYSLHLPSNWDESPFDRVAPFCYAGAAGSTDGTDLNLTHGFPWEPLRAVKLASIGHCEARSAEAISGQSGDCFAALRAARNDGGILAHL